MMPVLITFASQKSWMPFSYVDLERSTPVDSIHPLMGASSSRMYRFPDKADYDFNGKSSDYLQLGWLVAGYQRSKLRLVHGQFPDKCCT